MMFLIDFSVHVLKALQQLQGIYDQCNCKFLITGQRNSTDAWRSQINQSLFFTDWKFLSSYRQAGSKLLITELLVLKNKCANSSKADCIKYQAVCATCDQALLFSYSSVGKVQCVFRRSLKEKLSHVNRRINLLSSFFVFSVTSRLFLMIISDNIHQNCKQRCKTTTKH